MLSTHYLKRSWVSWLCCIGLVNSHDPESRCQEAARTERAWELIQVLLGTREGQCGHKGFQGFGHF